MPSTRTPSSPAITGAVTVIVMTIVPGLLIAFSAAYLSDDPAASFQREGIFHQFLFIVGTQTVCNVVGFLLTVPLYLACHLSRSRRTIITHAAIGTILATLSYYSGIPAKLQILLPPGIFSDSGLIELLLITTLAAALPYLLVVIIHGIVINSRE